MTDKLWKTIRRYFEEEAPPLVLSLERHGARHKPTRGSQSKPGTEAFVRSGGSTRTRVPWS
jgi:hypothetical protein